MSPETLLHTIPIYTPPAIDKAFSVSYSSYLSNNCAALCHPLTLDYPIIPFVIEKANRSNYSVTNRVAYRHTPYIDWFIISTKINSFNTGMLQDSGTTKRGTKTYALNCGNDSISVSHTNWNKLIVSGCPGKYWKGNNLSLSNQELSDSIDSISDALDVDMTECALTEVDIARTFKIDYPFSEMAANHGTLKGFERTISQGTLYYNHYNKRDNRDLVLKSYDVIKKAKAFKMDYSPFTDSDNLIKWELKTKNIHRLFGYAISVGEMLRDNEILDKIYSEMKHHYNNIQKTCTYEGSDIETQLIANAYPDPVAAYENALIANGITESAKRSRKSRFVKKLKELKKTESKYHLNFN